MFDFSDRIVLITGAAGNLGGACASAFHDAGAQLALADRSPEKIEKRRAGILDERVSIYEVDLLDADSVDRLVKAVIGDYGRIDVLANIAGGFTMGPTVDETPLETWEHMLNLNARSVFLMAGAVVPHMRQQGSGKIVNVSSRSGLKGGARMAPNSVSQGAVIRLTESLAAELKQHNINVNCILPATIDTPQNRNAMPDADWSKWTPPADLANVIMYLASDYSRAINGAAVPAYGRN